MDLLESIHLVRLTIKWKKCVLEIENSINLLKKKRRKNPYRRWFAKPLKQRYWNGQNGQVGVSPWSSCRCFVKAPKKKKKTNNKLLIYWQTNLVMYTYFFGQRSPSMHLWQPHFLWVAHYHQCPRCNLKRK